jgi:hypothetical protein
MNITAKLYKHEVNLWLKELWLDKGIFSFKIQSHNTAIQMKNVSHLYIHDKIEYVLSLFSDVKKLKVNIADLKCN